MAQVYLKIHLIILFYTRMDRNSLIAECARLHLALSKANATNHDLETKLKEKRVKIRNLAQNVTDKEKSKQKLQHIVDSLFADEQISKEAASILKVRNDK